MSLVTKEPRLLVPPFGIEADHPRNCDLLIQSIPGCRLRGAVDGSKGAFDVKTGEPVLPVDQARTLTSLPRIPGHQLHIFPNECRYEIIDPLCSDEVMCERITKWLKQHTAFSSGIPIKGVPMREGKLDIHRMKTLVREVVGIVAAGEAKKCRGSIPDMAEVDDLPGYYLLNPGIRTGTTQPVYEKDWDDWVQRLSQSGG